jgi:predicted RNase H-like nuclease (RuvC/YqgF family)
VEAVVEDLTADEGGGGDDDGSEHVERELSAEEKRIKTLERQVERLQGHVEELEATVAAKDDRIEELEGELEESRREERRDARERRTVSRLERRNDALERDLDEKDDRIEELEGKLARLKELWKLDHSNFADVEAKREGLVPVKPVDEFTKAAIEDAHESYGLATDDVVFLRNAAGAGRSTAQKLAAFEPRVVLVGDGGLSEVADEVLFEHEIPVGPADGVAMQEVDELAVARENDVEAVIDDWDDRAEDRRREQKAEQLDQLISEHRAEQKKEQRRS